jgi:hypothetical protein
VLSKVVKHIVDLNYLFSKTRWAKHLFVVFPDYLKEGGEQLGHFTVLRGHWVIVVVLNLMQLVFAKVLYQFRCVHQTLEDSIDVAGVA